MPKSRKRKIKRGGSSHRSKHSSKKKTNRKSVIIVVVIIAALGIATGVFLFAGGGSSSQRPTGETTTASGLKYVDEVIGTGPSPTTGQTVTVHYTGTFTNGTEFDSSLDSGQPFSFEIDTGSVIQGWHEGIKTMKVGGKRRLIVPPQLGYGARGKPPDIPPNATLIFDVELLGVK